MKNRKIFLAIAVLLVAIMALCACGENQFAKTVLDAYANVKTAKTINQTIKVVKGSEELATEQLSYNLETGKVTYTKTPLNGEAASGEKSFDKDSLAANLQLDSFNDVQEDAENGKLVCKMNAERAKTLYGLDGVSGDVAFTFVMNNGKLGSLTVAYTTANGNGVTISTVYAY